MSYREAVTVYTDAGWPSVIPVTAGKAGIPRGFTGHRGRWPTDNDYTVLKVEAPKEAGAALRLSAGPAIVDGDIVNGHHTAVIGIDVDHYSHKTGGDTLAILEAVHGPLPPTWRSSARPAPSGIRFYRVPAGASWPQGLVAHDPDSGEKHGHIDVVHEGHRYAVVWPTLHPDTGDQYRWYDPDGAISETVPDVDDLPELPDAWVTAFRQEPNERAVVDPDAEPDWELADEDDLEPEVVEWLTKALPAATGKTPGMSRHDQTLTNLMPLVRMEQAGTFRGATTAINRLGAAFVAAIGDRANEGAARAEWLSMLSYTRGTAATTPPDSPWVSNRAVQETFAHLADAAPEVIEQAEAVTAEVTAEEWGEPVPIVEAPLGVAPFPLDALPTWMAAAISAVAAELEVTIDMAAPIALGALSVATCGRLRVQPRPMQCDPCNLYVAVGAPPTSGKTPTLRRLLEQPIQKAQAELAERHQEDRIRWRKPLAELQKSDDPADQMEADRLEQWLGVVPRLMVGDVTPEALVKVLGEQKRGIGLVSDEGGPLLGLDRYRTDSAAAEKLDPYLKGYSGSPLSVIRVKEGGDTFVAADHMNVAMVVAAQPGVLATVFGDSASSVYVRRGFVARWLVTVPDHNIGSRRFDVQVDAAPVEAYQARLHAMAKVMANYGRPSTHNGHSSSPHAVVQVVGEAQAHYFELCRRYERMRNGDGLLSFDGEIDGWKAEDHLVRIAALLAFADAWPDPGQPVEVSRLVVGVDHLDRAAELTDYFLLQHMAASGRLTASDSPTGTEDEQAWLAIDRAIKSGRVDPAGPLTKRQLKMKVYRLRKLDLDQVLERLDADGWLKVEKATIRGKKTLRVRLRPDWVIVGCSAFGALLSGEHRTPRAQKGEIGQQPSENTDWARGRAVFSTEHVSSPSSSYLSIRAPKSENTCLEGETARPISDDEQELPHGDAEPAKSEPPNPNAHRRLPPAVDDLL